MRKGAWPREGELMVRFALHGQAPRTSLALPLSSAEFAGVALASVGISRTLDQHQMRPRARGLARDWRAGGRSVGRIPAAELRLGRPPLFREARRHHQQVTHAGML